MTVLEVMERVRNKAIALGVRKQLLSEPVLLALINDATDDFAMDTKVNLKHVEADSVDEQEYYDLPTDLISPKFIKVNGIPVTIKSLEDYYEYKYRNDS